jgi:hypothetical protein
MKMMLIRVGIITLLIIEALVAAFMTREVLILLTLGLMLVVGLILRGNEEWGFYTFTAAIPLLVTIGELYLPIGGLVLASTLGLIFLDSYPHWNKKESVIAIILPLLVLVLAVVSPLISGVLGLAFIFLLIAICGSALALFRNRLLKGQYRGDIG